MELSSPVEAEVSDTERPATTTVTDLHDAARSSTSPTPGASSRLIFVKDQLNKTTSYEYDTGGYLSKITDRNGNITQQQYNPRAIWSSESLPDRGHLRVGVVRVHEEHEDQFDPRNGKTEVRLSGAPVPPAHRATPRMTWTTTPTSEMVTQTRPTDDGAGLTQTYTNGNGRSGRLRGTGAGGPAEEGDGRGGRRTAYRYTASGEPGRVDQPDGSGNDIRPRRHRSEHRR